MPTRLALTKQVLESLLEEHPGERLVVHDTKQPGLIVELRPGGTLSYYLYRWSNGRPHRLRIGAFPEVTVDAARDQARKWIAKQIDGVDLAAVKRERQNEPTLGDLFTHWLETHAKLHKRTWEEDQRQFNQYLTRMKSRPLSQVKRSDVQALHARLGRESGHYAANRCLALIRAMFNKANDLGYEGSNPAKGIKKFREQSRDRFLQPSELPAFMEAVKAEPNESLRDLFLLCLYTGARRNNVQTMRWHELDLSTATWRIPTTKNGDPLTVHLTEPAVELLTDRKARAGKCEWVLPGPKDHIRQPRHAWERLCKRAGLEDLRMHDLRRSLGSYQAAANSSLQVIGKSLGHKSLQSTAVYARLNLDPVRASVDTAVAAMLAAAQTKEGAKDG